MRTLIIDTSHSILVVALAINGRIVESFQEQVSKKHSELLLVKVKELLIAQNLNPMDIDEIVITDGPGSYTGMRIGITFAKTFALSNTNLKIYSIDTLASITGLDSGFAFLDARSKRVFGAFINNGKVSEQRVYGLDEINFENVKFFGDVNLLGIENPVYGNVAQNIMDLKDTWKRIETIDTFVPRYIK